jgi:hypothetical protein
MLFAMMDKKNVVVVVVVVVEEWDFVNAVFKK